MQESLTNVAKHARASSAVVSLAADAGLLTLEISDDGVGIAEDWSTKKESFGLIGMRERAIAIGGTFQVLSGRNSGGLVRVVVPLAENTASFAAA